MKGRKGRKKSGKKRKRRGEINVDNKKEKEKRSVGRKETGKCR